MDETRSPVEAVATTATTTGAELKAAVEEVLDHVQEWVYDDNPPHTYCPRCLWDSRKNQAPGQGLSHKPDCALQAALELLRGFVGEH